MKQTVILNPKDALTLAASALAKPKDALGYLIALVGCRIRIAGK